MAFQRRKPAAVGVKAPYPGFSEPALASSIEKVPGGDRWIHEIKFDGYRVQVHLVNEAVKVFTRRGNDWTKRFKKIADDAWHISAGSAIIDGEIVVPSVDDHRLLGAAERTQGQVDQDRHGGVRPAVSQRLRSAEAAPDRAEDTAQEADCQTDIQFSESFEVDGRDIFAHVCSVGLEGVVSKVRDSRYASGRGNNWVKKSCAHRETMAIAGLQATLKRTTPPRGT